MHVVTSSLAMTDFHLSDSLSPCQDGISTLRGKNPQRMKENTAIVNGALSVNDTPSALFVTPPRRTVVIATVVPASIKLFLPRSEHRYKG